MQIQDYNSANTVKNHPVGQNQTLEALTAALLFIVPALVLFLLASN